MAKAIGIKQLLQKKYRLVPGLSQEMKDSIGEIEDAFTMIVWGRSGQGKTNFVIKLVKELSTLLGPCLYNSLEEGHGKTIQDLAIRHNLGSEGSGKIIFLDNEHYDDLFARLKRKKSAKIIVIDSIQYLNMDYQQYKKLKETFKRKIFIFVSHSNGREPRGATATSIRYDVNIKVFVEGFIADITSRYGGNKNYVIEEQRAKGFWGKKFQKKVNKLGGRKPVEKKKATPDQATTQPETNTRIQFLPEEKTVFKTA